MTGLHAPSAIHCPFCRCPTRSSLACPQCSAPVHPACAWELGACASCNSRGVLDLLAAARLGTLSTPSNTPSWTVERSWAATVAWTAPTGAPSTEPQLRLTLDPKSLRGLWICGEVSLELPHPTWVRGLQLECSGDARSRLQLLPPGQREAGTWTISVRLRRTDGSRPVELRVGLRAGRGLFRRTRLRTGLRVGSLV